MAEICDCSLSSLKSACKQASPLVKVYGACTDDVAAIPAITDTDPVFHTIATDITMGSGGVFQELTFFKDTAKYSAPAIDADGLDMHDNTITGKIQGKSGYVLSQVEKWKNRGLVVIVEFEDGTRRLVGSLTRPVYFKFNETVSGFDVEGKTTTSKVAPYYTGAIPV